MVKHEKMGTLSWQNKSFYTNFIHTYVKYTMKSNIKMNETQKIYFQHWRNWIGLVFLTKNWSLSKIYLVNCKCIILTALFVAFSFTVTPLTTILKLVSLLDNNNNYKNRKSTKLYLQNHFRFPSMWPLMGLGLCFV